MIIKSQLKITYEKYTVHLYIHKNEYTKVHEIKKIILTMKLIFHK